MIELPAQSLLDTDLYKLTMQQAVLAKYPNVDVEYRWGNRNGTPFSNEAVDGIRECIERMAELRASDEEIAALAKACPFFTPSYLAYLKNYRFNPKEVEITQDNDDNFAATYRGKWHSDILWEIPGLYIPSAMHYTFDDTDWSDEGQEALLREKGKFLWDCTFAEFGTRRRRNFASQDRAVRILKDNPGFVGTSNVHLALKYGVKPIGTLAHEWPMIHQVLYGIRHCNRAAMQAWNDVYKGNLGIALPDTIGSDAFFADFDGILSRLWDGTRHDSGDPYEYGDKAIGPYGKKVINPCSKSVVFSDGLRANADAAPDKNPNKIREYFEGRIKTSFGIGTDFTNDFPGSPALNIVIKPFSVNGIPVVKYPDSAGKAMGDPDAQRVVRYISRGISLDTPLASLKKR